MPKILFVAAHRPGRSPSQRFRFEQYLSFLKKNGFEYDFSYLISEKDDKTFYQPGNISNKIFFFAKSIYRRLSDAINANNYDIIFVQREAFMTGSTFFEKRFSKSKAKLIFDFDDAIWHLDISEANKKFEWLKHPGKTAEIISVADLVIAGNQYLADYARHHNDHIVIVPTTIDTSEYLPRKRESDNNPICIGWSGSLTTIKHFEMAVPFLKMVKEKFGERICIKVIGDSSYVNTQLNIKGINWNKQDELKELNEIDIGIMPLPDDEWSKGKCGLKGLQYMALGIATVMSPVGVNSEIIKDGMNGFLASTNQEWFEKISMLIESETLRNKIAEAGRGTVEEKYSVNAQKENYLKYFKDLIN